MEKITFLCCNQDDSILIWEQYGYWHADKKRGELYPMPSWANKECKERVAYLVKHLQEPDLKVKIETYRGKNYDGSGCWCARWELYDPNNPHIAGDSGAVGGCRTEQSAYDYAMKRYSELKHLYDGDVEALLVYKKTGIACLPNWNTNDIDSWGYKWFTLKNGKKVIRKFRIPRAREVLENKQICLINEQNGIQK